MKFKVETSVKLVGLTKIARRLKLSQSFVSRVFHGKARSARVERYLKRYGLIKED